MWWCISDSLLMASPSCLASRGFLRPNSWTAASSSERVRPQLSKSSARHWEKEMKTSLISHPELYFNLAFQTKSINISLTVRPGQLTHLDLLFGVINIRRFFLEFSRDCFEFLRDVMESWAEVLFNFSGFLNFSLFRKNLQKRQKWKWHQMPHDYIPYSVPLRDLNIF